MAEVVTLKSDLSGKLDTPSDPVKARRYTWEGEAKRIDLSDTEYAGWCEAQASYLAASRPDEEAAGTRTIRRRGDGSKRDTEGSRAKAWAREHGAELSGPGACPSDVLDAFRKDDPTLIAERIGATNGHAPSDV